MITLLLSSFFIIAVAGDSPIILRTSEEPLNISIINSSGSSYRTTSTGEYAAKAQRDLNEHEDGDEFKSCEVYPDQVELDDVESMSLLELLEKTKEQFVVRSSDGILLLGNSETSKSSVSQVITGDLSKLNVYKGKDGHLIILPSQKKTAVTKQSLKLTAELVTDPTNHLNLYNCPGFTDNRRENADIIVNYFMKELTDSLSTLRLVFVVSSKAMGPGGRSSFDDLVISATQMLNNFDKMEEGIGMIVTNVKTPNKAGQQNTDEAILMGIKSSINQYKEDQQIIMSRTIDIQTKFLLQRKIMFVEILLQKDRIAFLRDPTKCGSFNQSEFSAKGKADIIKLIRDDLRPVSSNHDDFRYFISDNTLQHVASQKDHLNKEATSLTSTLIAKLRKTHYQKSLEMKIFFKIKNFVEDDKGNFSEVLIQTHGNYSFASFGKFLASTLSFRGYETRLGEKFMSNMERLQSYKDFFDLVSDKEPSYDYVQWKEPLQTWVADLSTRREWFDFLFSLRDIFSTFNFQAEKPFSIPTTIEELKTPLMTARSSIVTDKIVKLYKNPIILREEKQILWELVDEAFQKIEIQCKELEIPVGESNPLVEMTVTGSFVKSSDFSSLPMGSSSCRRVSAYPSIVKVFATRTVFFDQNISPPKDRTYELAIVAPQWEVISGISSIQIDLRGRNGAEILQRRPTPNAPPVPEKGEQISPDKVPQRLKNQCPGMGDALNGSNGSPGRAGESGFPGGHFIGFSEQVEGGERLLVQASGGSGSDGEDGQEGGSGEEGKDFPYERWPYASEIGSYECGPLTCKMTNGWKLHHDTFWVVSHFLKQFYCRTFGCPGGLGGDGGNGGAKGLGGLKGRIEIISLKGAGGLRQEEWDGLSGSVGKGGPAGIGGKRGNGWEAKHMETPFAGRFWEEASKGTVSTFDRSTDGNLGRDGANSVGQKSLRQPFFTLSKHSVLLQYKLFAIPRQSIAFPDEFISRLEASSEVARGYSPLKFAQELLVLEQVNLNMRNKEKREKVSSTLLPAYESQINRIETFTLHATNPSDADKVLLSLLFSTALNQVRTLKQVYGTLVVLDVNGYLATLERRIKDYEKAETKQLVEEERTNYGRRFEEKIRETMKFITGTVDPALKSTEEELVKIRKELKEELGNLVIGAMASVEEYKRQKEQMKNVMMIRGFLSVLQVGAAALTIFGGPLAPIGVIVGGVTTAVDKLALGDGPSVRPLPKIPGGVQMVSDALEERSKVVSEEKLGLLGVLINESREAVAENPEILEAWTQLIDNLEESVKLLRNKRFSGSMKEFRELESKVNEGERILKGKLEDTKFKLEETIIRRSMRAGEEMATTTKQIAPTPASRIKTSAPTAPTPRPRKTTATATKPTPKPRTKSTGPASSNSAATTTTPDPRAEEKAKEAAERVLNALKTAGDLGLEIYEAHKKDADKLAEISSLVDEASTQLQNIRRYEEAVKSVLGPVMDSAIEDLEIAKRDMKGKSEVFLRMQQWKVANIFRQYGTLIKEFIEGLAQKSPVKGLQASNGNNSRIRNF